MATALQEQSYSFDDRQIQWSPFPGIENASFSLCDYDEERGIVDLIFKFEPDKKIAIHTHIWQTNMFIIEGELRMYNTDGSVKEVRATGKYFSGCENDTHSEGGGPNGAIVFYTVRSNGGEEIFDLLDDEGTIITTITRADIKSMWLEKEGVE